MKADNIKNIISDIDHLPYRAILFDGTWGIGKSYAVNEALGKRSIGGTLVDLPIFLDN